MMGLQKDLKRMFDNEISRYGEEKKMPYITSVERLGMIDLQQENVIDILSARFGELPPEIVEQINNLDDLPWLKQLLKQAATIGSLLEFQQLLNP